jgi:hypothetical protein
MFNLNWFITKNKMHFGQRKTKKGLRLPSGDKMKYWHYLGVSSKTFEIYTRVKAALHDSMTILVDNVLKHRANKMKI